jgi:hypothetical protein
MDILNVILNKDEECQSSTTSNGVRTEHALVASNNVRTQHGYRCIKVTIIFEQKKVL